MTKAMNLLHGYLLTILAAGSLFLMAVFAPMLEAFVAPVLTQVNLVESYREGDTAIFRLMAHRGRSACEFAGITALVDDGKTANAATVDTPFKSSSRPVSRPAGVQMLGRWGVKAPPDARVWFALRYECHAFWDMTQQIGPFTAPR